MSSKDDDLVTTCICGCVSIVKRNGYHICTLDDAAKMGDAAATLCRVSLRHPWVRALKKAWIWALLLLLTTGATWAGMERRAAAIETATRLVKVGEDKLDANDNEGAIEAFTEALEVRQEPLTFNLRGFARYRKGDYLAAIADCESALKLDPTNEAAKKNLATARGASRIPVSEAEASSTRQ